MFSTCERKIEEEKESLLYSMAYRLNWMVERICSLLMGVMVVVIWFEVVERYFPHLGFTWTEEFSRYVMMWATLLAVSCGAFYREHIGLNIVKRLLPPKAARILEILLDIVSLLFFCYLAWHGIGMAKEGMTHWFPGSGRL